MPTVEPGIRTRKNRPGYEVYASHGRRADGKPRRLTGHADTLDDARTMLATFKIRLGKDPMAGDPLPLDAYFEMFLRRKEQQGKAVSTITRYRGLYRRHISPALGNKDIANIRALEVARWLESIESPHTARKALTCLKAVLNQAYNDELLAEKPLQRSIELPRVQKQRPEIWQPGEVVEAMTRLRDNRMEVLWLVMVGAGLRREEALALTKDDFRFETVYELDGTQTLYCRLNISKTKTELDGLQDHTKTYRERMVSISDPFAGRLQEILADWTASTPMVEGLRGPLAPSSIPETWRALWRQGAPLHGMRYVELRTMRHTHETIVSNAGISDAINSAVHGHSRQVSYGHYNQYGAAAADRAADAVRMALA